MIEEIEEMDSSESAGSTETEQPTQYEELRFAPHFETEEPGEFPLPEPLLVRLKHDHALLPAGVTTQLPRHLALMLIRRKLATPCGDLALSPALVLDEAEAYDALRFTV